MLFNSLHFALFLPVVFAVYWLLRPSLRCQNLFILAASCFFYACWDPRFLLLIAFTSLASYLSGLAIHRSSGQGRRWFLWANVSVNLLILCLFKYYDFFAQSFADLFLGGRSDHLLLHLVLPVGISFYTFQALSYSIDVYRRSVTPTRDPVAFFAYVSFFPQLVAGPIERASSLLPQFLAPRSFSYSLAVQGLRQMLWGFFKKMVVADSCALYVDRGFSSYSDCSAPSLIIAALLFSIQIYADFSGYSDIAIGCAKLFGISLRRNFNVPYFSRDIAEFWRRWHISLTSWFRDYFYIPLGGSRAGRWRSVANTFIIFLVSGLWHGANWTFLLWGFYHALLFLPLILLGRNRRHLDTVAPSRPLLSLPEFFQMLLTFLLATLGWIFFRSPSIEFSFSYIARMLGMGSAGQFLSPVAGDHFIILPAIFLMLSVEWFSRHSSYPFARQPRSRTLRWVGYMSLIFIIIAFSQTSEMPFIYFQF